MSSVKQRTLKVHRGAAAFLGPRRGHKSRTFGIWYVCEHRLLTMRAYLSSILTTSVCNPVMYLFALGVGIGSYIDASSGSGGLLGVSYLTFVGPALLASAAITAATDETSFPVMGGFKWTREFWAMNATPLSAIHIAGGVILAALIRIVGTVLIFWLFLKAFGASPGSMGILSVPAAILGGLSMGSLMMAIAAALKEDDGWFALINRLVIAPMFLFSGTFFPLESMPAGFHWIGWISPLWHATQLGRFFTFDLPLPAWQVLVHGGYLLALSILGLGLSVRIFARRLSA